MERHAALHDLSRDHHTVLLHAQRLDRAIQEGPQAALAASRAFIQYWGVLRSHLDEEVRLVVPRATESALQGRYQMIEEALRQAVDQLRITLMDPQFFRPSIQQLIPLLKRHVNFCEANLFPDVQGSLGDAELQQLAAASVAYRKQVRPDAIGPNRAEECFIGHAPRLPEGP